MTASSLQVVVPEDDFVPTIVDRSTGEVVDLTNLDACVGLLTRIRDAETETRSVKAVLTEAIVEISRKQGTKTLPLADGGSAVVSSGDERVFDAEGVEEALRAAGMDEARIREIVVETVSLKVDARKADQAARANPAYARAIEQHVATRPKTPTVAIKK